MKIFVNKHFLEGIGWKSPGQAKPEFQKKLKASNFLRNPLWANPTRACLIFLNNVYWYDQNNIMGRVIVLSTSNYNNILNTRTYI